MATKKRNTAQPSTTAAPSAKGYTPERVFQKLLAMDFFEDLALDPKIVPRLYLENVILRTLSRMMGQGPYGPVTVKCTKDGSLAVVSRGGAFDAYERQDHTFALSGAERTADATEATKLVDSSEDFLTEGIKAGDAVFNTTDSTKTFVVSVAETKLTLEDDIFVDTETYKIYPCKEFTLSRQVERLDIFTYNGKVDYQLSRDSVQALGAKIPLFEDSFYSLDFYTLRARASLSEIPAATATRSTLFGWYRIEG